MIARLLCWLFGHDEHNLWVGEHFGGIYCPRCNRCALLPPPHQRRE